MVLIIYRLNTLFQNVKQKVIVERGMADRKVIKDQGFDVELEELKLENEKLKDKDRKMQTIIHGLNAEKTNKFYGPKKNLIQANTNLVNQHEKNEYLKMINLLREQLKKSEAHCDSLDKQLNGPGAVNNKLSGEYSKDVT